MNNLYYAYNNDLTAKMEMEQRRREIDHIHLLREAGLTNPGWTERFMVTVGSLLSGHGRKLRAEPRKPHKAYQITSGKLVP